MDSLNAWIQKEFSSVLGYGPTYHILSQGWLGFVFRSEEDTMNILKAIWFMDTLYLAMKSWHPLFDAKADFSS
jgi:hypothetical protein